MTQYDVMCMGTTCYTTVHRNIWQGKNLANLTNCELFTKIFLTNIQIHFSSYALTSQIFPSTCMVHQNFPPPIFPMYGILL